MEREVVLIVDDDETILSSYKRALRREPYEILTTSSGAEALSIVKAGGVHAVVTDEEMPELTGTELLRIIRATDPSLMRVMLTGKANLGVACAAINVGEVHRFLLKPSTAVELAVAIRDVLKMRAVQVHSDRFVQQSSMQTAYMEQLEEQYPGISQVRVSETGSILLDLNSDELEDILELVEED